MTGALAIVGALVVAPWPATAQPTSQYMAQPSAATPVPPRLRGTCLKHVRTKKRVVALTFDAGGGNGGVRKILRTLHRESMTGTFFLTGRWARQFPKDVASIAQGGHVLGNHTNTHRKVSMLSTSVLRDELRATNRAVRASAGRGTKPWFRFPYGAHTPNDIARVNDLGYACVQWTVDTAGWMGTSGHQTVTSVVDRVIAGLRPGEIVLMHVGQNPTDGSTLDADALGRIIDAVRSHGYGFTTLATMLPTAPPPTSASAAPVSPQ
jgi:peptidoglycan/xylan/chitin deacetylase (PgdA/CDA1 family)